MKYPDYVRNQVEIHGQIKKPYHYRLGEKRAINWFFLDVDKDQSILDVGAGIGTGIKYLHELGYERVVGIDLNPRKALFGNNRWGLNIFVGDVAEWEVEETFDVFWISHVFEHMFNPELAIHRIKQLANKHAKFFFVLPYVDTGDTQAHCSSEYIGLRKDDEGERLIKWFEDRGLILMSKRFDNFREKEIWLRFTND